MDTAREYTKRLADLLRVERGITADFLLALAEFDRRKLWRELDHTSLFNFLHRELKLSRSAAHARWKAAELIQNFPEVEAAIRAGQLCLSTMAELARVVTAENHAEVMPRFFGLSKRDAEMVAASILPAKVIPTRTTVTAIRPAAAPATVAAVDPVPLSVIRPGELDSPARDVSVGPPQPSAPTDAPTFTLTPAAPPPPVVRDAMTPLNGDLARLNITVSREFLAKLEAAKDALGHVFPAGDAADVLERGLDLVLAEHAKRNGLVETPRKAAAPSGARHVPAAVKREVWKRAGGRCEFVLASGERCASRRALEYDHVTPVALGGRARAADDVRLCCRGHNQLAARRIFGDVVMDRYARADERSPGAGFGPTRADRRDHGRNVDPRSAISDPRRECRT